MRDGGVWNNVDHTQPLHVNFPTLGPSNLTCMYVVPRYFLKPRHLTALWLVTYTQIVPKDQVPMRAW